MVVDDSALMRSVISDMLNSDPDIEVVGTANNGEDAIHKIEKFEPDAVTLDIEMPVMDGLTALRKIMSTDPLPVVMVSALTDKGSVDTIRALEYGAVDFIHKPSGSISLNMEVVKEDLIRKVKIARSAKLRRPRLMNLDPITSSKDFSKRLIAIGSSTGGPSALMEVIPRLPKNTPPVLIVQHMPAGFTKTFAERLDKESSINVREAAEGDKIESGTALLAPGDYHMVVKGNERIHLTKDPPINFVRPAVDPMMESVADIYGKNVIGVILTGMGSDGAVGLSAIKRRNGQTIAQDKDSCVVFGMPGAAVDTGCVDKVTPLSDIPEEILRRC
ncbi:MAG: chemotaxis response regulator protein-glutamate methylesterase [Halobacteriota archaeon]|nr:chemotaxis response regulator protein-glutamate methylesterase [Halobacteriota archaeon]